MGKYFSSVIKGNLFTGDKSIWMIYFFLCLISMVEVYSASSQLTYEDGRHWARMLHQLGFLLAGFLVVIVVHKVPYRYFMLIPVVLVIVSVGLLLYTSIGGGKINGASRWIDLGFITFQPSELAKAALVSAVAVILAKTQGTQVTTLPNGKKITETGAVKGKNRARPFWYIAGLTTFMCFLIFMENLSTAFILFVVVVIMMFIGRIPIDLIGKMFKYYFVFGAAIVAICLILPEKTVSEIPGLHRVTTWKHRLFDKEEAKDTTEFRVEKRLISDDKLQETHAQIAIANSNIIGRGPGNSVERDFLSHAESDFIFAIIIEELGILGGLFVISLYLALLFRIISIVSRCKTDFPAFLALGLGLLIVLQAVIHMGVATGCLPVTGQPLPIISRGGSSLLLNCAYFGMILSISRSVLEDRQKAESQTMEEDGQENNYQANTLE